MVSNAKTVKLVLSNPHVFKPTFPASKERMLGQKEIPFQKGEYHIRLKKLVLRACMRKASY